MGKGSWELLLAVEHEEGVAGVFRDREDGSFWLSGTVEHGGSGMTERRFTFEGLRDAWVQGGFLPPDATRVLAGDAQRALEQLATPLLPNEAWQRLFPAALTVLMERDRLRAGERVASVVVHELAVTVEGRARHFLAGRCGDGWAAIATLSDRTALTVMITADEIPPEAVSLERVRNIEPYLAAPPG